MADLLHKIGPVAVVSIIFTWICWPYITGSATAIGGNGDGTSITLPNNLLSPSVQDSNKRDPFQVVKSAAMNLIQGKLAGATDTTSEKQNAGQAGTAANATNQGNTIALTGVYIQGDNRMAILNGTLYRIGENIKGPASVGKPWILTQVLPDRVIVSRGRKTRVIEMSFPVATAPAAEAGPAATPNSPSSEPNKASPEETRPQLKSVMSLEELFEAVRERKKP